MDESALVSTYERYHQQLYRYCYSILGDPEDAQDALQSTMLKALRALPGERRRIELKPWLYRIAHNESIDLLRRRRGEAQIDPELLVAAGGPEETAATRERLRRLLADLTNLPERQREALVMRELGGLSFAELGAALETTPETARQTVYEARLNLRQLEAGREMDCANVMRQISDADGRVLRRRDIQAHLRACPECSAFREGIEGRQRDLAAIAPLPAVAATGILQSLLSGVVGGGGTGAAVGAGAGTAGTVGAGAGKVLGTSVVVKSMATVAVVAALGVGAADRGGLLGAGSSGGDPSQSTERAGDRAPAAGQPAAVTGADSPEDAAVRQPANPTGVEDGAADTAAQAPAQITPANGQQSTPAAEPEPGSSPSTNHGQEVAASHGGGKAHGQSQGQAKGKSKQAQGAQGKGSPPPHAGHASKPATSTRPPRAKPEKGKSAQVAPDVSPEPALKPSQPPKNQGATGAAGGPPSKEAR